MEPLTAAIGRLQAAQEASRARLEHDVAGARDQLLPALRDYAEAERAWLHAPGDADLAQSAEDAFDALLACRAGCRQAVAAAVARRDQAQAAAWAQITAAIPAAP